MLIGQIAQPWHEGIAEQITQPKDVLGKAVRIGVVFAHLGLPARGRYRRKAQNRIVFEQSVQHVKRFSRGTGDDARAENRVLIGGVRVKATARS